MDNMGTWMRYRAVILALLVALLACAEGVPLRLIHLNDLHGRWDAETTTFTVCKEPDICFGGFPKLTSAAAALKKSAPGDALILHAGDQFVGTAFDTYYTSKGDVVGYKFLNIMGVDFFVPGNHEYDFGPVVLSSFVTKLNATTVSCNTVVNATALPELAAAIRPFAIATLPSGLKVGIVGFTTLDTAKGSSGGPNVRFLPPEDTAAACAAEARAAGAQVVIALSHLGYLTDVPFATKFSEYDVIVGGHSHSFLWNGPQPLILTSPLANETHQILGAYPTMVDSFGGKTQIPVAQAYCYSRWLGVLDLEVDTSGSRAAVKVAPTTPPNPILMGGANSTNPVPDDPTAAALLATLKAPLLDIANKVVGTTSVFLDATAQLMRTEETSLGNLMNDACTWFIEKYSSLVSEQFPDTPYASITAAGSFRQSIDVGNITMGEITAVFPFGNTLMVKEMNASGLLADLNAGVAQMGNAPFPQVGHMAYSFAPVTRPNNSRILRAVMYDSKGKAYDLTSLPPDFKVLVIVNNFMGGGGDGYTNIGVSTLVDDTSVQITDVLADYVTAFSPVEPAHDGRLTNCDKTPEAPLCGTATPTLQSPTPTAAFSPPPPATPKPKTCSWSGVYRIQSVACPGKFISFMPATGPGKGCVNDTVTLRPADGAPPHSRSWKLVAKAQQRQPVLASRVAAAQRLPSCGFKVNLASADSLPSPRLAGPFWKLRIKPVSYADCSVVSMQAVAGAQKDAFLAYSSTCSGNRAFRWVGKVDEHTHWKLTKMGN